MSSQRVTLLGGTGFVGTQLINRLAGRFDEVVVLTRRASRCRTLRLMPNVHAREVDVHDSDALTRALSGSAVVINLIGILNESGSAARNSFDSAHDGLIEKVIAACTAGGVPRYLHMSALKADAEQGSSAYLRSKGRGEAHVRQSPASLQWTIFQPSVIFGEEDAFFNRFAELLRSLPVFPLAVPDALMAPVYVGDVCQSMIDAIDNPATFGATLQLCGPDNYTLRQLVEYTAHSAGLNRKIVGLPNWASKLQARMLEFVPGKPFTRDNYLSLQTANICDDGCARQPTSVQAKVPRYLGANDWTGRLQKRRRSARR